MNIIERNYLPKLNIRETQEAYLLMEKLLLDKISNQIEVTQVRQPVVSSGRVSITSNKEDGNRQINFDSSNDNIVYYIYNDFRYWLVNTISKLEIKNNNAIILKANYIDRDVEIKNTQSMERNKLLIEYRFDSEEQKDSIDKAIDLNKKIFAIIKSVQNEIISKYPELKSSKLPITVDEKDLSKITSRSNLKNTISDVASDEGTFLLRDIRDAKKERSVENTFELSLYSFKKEINEAYRIYKIQDRRTMEDIEPFTSESESIMEEYNFGREVLKDNNTKTINIEIDLDALALLILDKSHILELQSGLSISEIEKILVEADIEHL